MSRVSFIDVPESLEELYWAGLQSGDRFTIPRIIRKSVFFSREKIANLTAKSYLPICSELWKGFTDQQKEDWKNVDPGPHPHGWRTFVADQSKRIKFGIEGVATPSQYHQDLVGAIAIAGAADEVKLIQYHPAQYYVSHKVTGKKSMYEPVSVTEALALPLKITLNYLSNLISLEEDSFAKFYAKVRHFYQGQNLDTNLEIAIPIDLALIDNFDSYNDGPLAGQGDWLYSTNFTVGSDFKYGISGKGVEGDGGPGGDKVVTHGIDDRAKGRISFKCQPDQTNGVFGIFLTSQVGIAGYFMFNSDGNVNYYNGVEFKIIKASYTANQWYRCQIEWDASRGANGEIRYKIDDEEWTEWDTPAAGFEMIQSMSMWMTSPYSRGFFDDFGDEWETANATLTSVIGLASSYNLYIHLYHVKGTLLFDNPKAEHSAQNWVRDPYCKDISETFTKAFYQVPKHWAAITLPEGAAYNSKYPE